MSLKLTITEFNSSIQVYPRWNSEFNYLQKVEKISDFTGFSDSEVLGIILKIFSSHIWESFCEKFFFRPKIRCLSNYFSRVENLHINSKYLCLKTWHKISNDKTGFFSRILFLSKATQPESSFSAIPSSAMSFRHFSYSEARGSNSSDGSDSRYGS